MSIGSDLSHRPLSTLDKSLVTSCTSFFALVASPIAGLLADKLGRKKVILVADILFIVGALWQAWSGSVWSMIAGRSIVGLAVGGASLVVPLYVHFDNDRKSRSAYIVPGIFQSFRRQRFVVG